MKNAYRKFLLAFGLSAAVASLPLIANILFLRHAGEISGIRDIVRAQRERKALYGSALVDSTFRYKLELVRQTRPDVVALGSSRTMQVQHEIFNTSFANAAGSMRSLREGLLFLREMTRFHRPKLLVLGVDHNWFMPATPEPTAFPEHGYVETDITRDKLMYPYLWIATQKISPERYGEIVAGRDLKNPYSTYEPIGIFATEQSNGFRYDGFRFYGARYWGKDPGFADRKFASTISDFQKGQGGFERDQPMEASRFAEMEEIIALCQDAGIKLVLIMTPSSQTLHDLVEKDGAHYRYIDEVKRKLEKRATELGVEYYDFEDLKKFGSGDCECVDGTHAGSVAYYRIFRRIQKDNPRSVLAPFLDLPAIDAAIARFQGKALVLPPGEMPPLQEADFLELGCRKTP